MATFKFRTKGLLIYSHLRHHTGYPVSEMATFKFRAKGLLIYSHLRTNEINFLQSVIRTWIALLEFMSHIIHVLKSVVNNRE